MIADLTKGWLSSGVDRAFAAQRQAGGMKVKGRGKKRILASHDHCTSEPQFTQWG